MKSKTLGLVIVSFFIILSAIAVSATCIPTRIMPLGDSITVGYGINTSDFSTMVGYRQFLQQKLASANYPFDFVGSQNSGYAIPGFDYDNEGYLGLSSAEAANSVYQWLMDNPVDIVLLHIGTNNLITDVSDVARILDEIDRFKQDLHTQVKVVLAQILNRQTYSADTTTFNNNLYNLFLVRKAAGDKIWLVDMEHALIYPDDMSDIVHPNPTGYSKMADFWFSALGELLNTCTETGNQFPNGMIDIPVANVTINTGDFVSFSGTGSDSDNNTPLTYLWQFGTGSGIPDSTVANPGSIQFNISGTYTVSFTITDFLGLSDPTPAKRVITVLPNPNNSQPIPQTSWKLQYADSEELTGWNGAAVNAFDGSASTIWHTQFMGGSPPPPHEIEIDLGDLYLLHGFRYLPRQDGGVNGRIGQYEFFVSDDGKHWGSPVAVGTFANDSNEKEILFAGKMGRFVRLRALSEVNGNPWTSMAELNVLGDLYTGKAPPNGSITTPSKDITINPGDTVEFKADGYDPEGDLPLKFKWSFGAGAGLPDLTVKDPGQVQFTIPGTFVVTLMTTNASGLSDPTPDTVTITVRSQPVELIPNWMNVSDYPFPVSPVPTIVNPVLKGSMATDVPGLFVANPFLFHEGNKWYLFFEVYNNGQSDIGFADSTDGLHWTYRQIVLHDSINHSFPMVFKYNGKYYLLPESYEANEVRLYEATSFPTSWQLVSELVTGRPFVANSIFNYNNTWWMFSSDPSNSKLYLFYSDNLLGGWIEHPRSPLVFNDASKSRPGGRVLIFDNGRIVRLAQKDDVVYGEAVRAFEIDLLTKTDYREHEMPESPVLNKTGNGWNASGMHNLDCWWSGGNWLCSVDGWYLGNDYSWSIGMYVSGVSHSIIATSSPGGSISPSGVVTVSHGATQTFIITSATGYAIEDVKVDGTSVGAVGSYTFSNVSAHHTIEAVFTVFKIKTYTIHAVAGPGGSISPSGDVTVNYNGSQTVIITPGTGYAISDVKVDGTSKGAVSIYTFNNVSTNHTITAVFKIKTYTIHAVAGPGGSISPSGDVTVNYNGSQTVIITPGTGYAISDVKVDGTSKGAVSIYTFNKVSTNHTITAVFKKSKR
jgi:lysophospholipase L1-like esterase